MTKDELRESRWDEVQRRLLALEEAVALLRAGKKAKAPAKPAGAFDSKLFADYCVGAGLATVPAPFFKMVKPACVKHGTERIGKVFAYAIREAIRKDGSRGIQTFSPNKVLACLTLIEEEMSGGAKADALRSGVRATATNDGDGTALRAAEGWIEANGGSETVAALLMAKARELNGGADVLEDDVIYQARQRRFPGKVVPRMVLVSSVAFRALNVPALVDAIVGRFFVLPNAPTEA